jgi:hypothetical protein
VSDTRNLLAETVAFIEKMEHTVSDVRWVGNDRYWLTWDEFAAIADVEYDSGFGGAEVPQSLMVVGDDWWLERHEYDGSEWWEYKMMPVKPIDHGDAVTAVVGYEASRDWEPWPWPVRQSS